MTKIITISGRAEHGKDLTASILKNKLEKKGKRVLIIHYADLLKFICSKYFNWDGEKDKNGRTLLQWVGTEVVRTKKPTYWVDFVKGFVELFKDAYDYVLIPDTRFPNEIDSWKQEGWNIVSLHVERLNYESSLTPEQRLHPSETSLDNYKFDYYIKTISGKQYLEKEIDKFIKYLQEEN